MVTKAAATATSEWTLARRLAADASRRLIERDLHTGVDAARLMSLLMLVFSVAPILAPLCGSLLIEWSSWRSVFWAVMLIAVAALVVMATSLAETRPAAQPP